MSDWPQSLVLVGAGKMGGAMLRGWLAGGLPGPGVAILEPSPSDEIRALAAEQGLKLNPSEETIEAPQALALAIKPQSLDAAASRLARLAGPATLVVSVLAGKTIANLQ